MKKQLLLAASAAVLFSNMAIANDTATVKKLTEVAPYPAPQKNSNRHVIWLPQKQDESLYQVQVVATKSGKKDCNNTWYGAELDDKTLEGWGYNYYVINDIKGPMSTLMACPGGKAVQADIPVRLDDSKIRYNSKLPIVVYAPKDVKVSYRIWSADEATLPTTIENK